MEDSRWSKSKQLFNDALELPAAERGVFVERASGGDAGLREAVSALLASEERSGAFLERRPNDVPLLEQLQRALAGRFSIELELRRGGMGIVYLARDVALDRLVAIKLLPPSLAADAAFRARFLREARTAAGLSHPHIVPIHLVEEKDDLVYFVMSYVDGESLGDHVRRAGPLKHPEVARLVQEVAWALGYSHARGVVHRDIKPDNILIDRASGRAMVTDFGIARVMDGATAPGELMGTAAYMSPEHVNGAPLDGRADLYSLGVTAFFALTGRLPFEAADAAALGAMHLSLPAPPVRSVNSMVPMRLAEAIDRCLAKDPAARPPSGEKLAEAIASTQLTQRDVAPSIRDFLAAVKHGIVQATLLAGGWMGLGASGLAATAGGTVLEVMLALWTPIVLLHPLLAARGVRRAGMNETDVAEAITVSSTVRDANVEYEVGRAERLARRFSHPLSRMIFGAGATALPLVLVLTGPLRELPPQGRIEALAIAIYVGYTLLTEAFFLAMVIAPAKTVATLTRGMPENAGFLRRLWRGPVGRLLFGIAGLGLSRARALPPAESAPTEAVLGRAAGDLFEQLPDEVRRGLGDVPDVLRRLEHAATSLRARRDDLSRALADAGTGGSGRRAGLVADLEQAREQTEERLASAVGALENLRLDLLRMRARVGNTDDLTGSLEEARAIGTSVDIELSALRDLGPSIRET